MKPLIQSDFDLISRYIDNDLTEQERASFERRCEMDPEFRRELEEWLRMKKLLGDRPVPGADPAFWTRLSAELKARRDEDDNLLPFPRRALPAVVGIASVFVAALGFALMQNSYPILRFWERQSSAVREAMNSGVIQGSLLPMFTSLDPDRALQFALYGTLPLDEDKGTTLKVDERNRDGYRIEVQKEVPRKQKKVTVAEFLAQVRPSSEQRLAIDSLLTMARQELEGAVLVGANREVAINADLHRLNKTMVSGLAACLEPEQRVRLNRLLTEREAPYVVVAQSKDHMEMSKVMESIRPTRPHREFVIVRSDTVEMSRMSIDVQHLRQEMESNRSMFLEMAERRARLFEQWSTKEEQYPFVAPTPESMPRVLVRTHRGRLTIDVNDSSIGRTMYFNIAVTPRLQVGEGVDIPGVLELEVEAPQEATGAARTRVVIGPQGVRARIAPVDTGARPRRPLPVDIQ